MAPSLKLSLLALVGAAAAVPGHGHDKFHKRHNYPMTNSTTSIAADVPADAATHPLPAIATHVYLNTSSVADAQMTSSGAAHVSSAAADAAAGTSMYPNEAAGSASKANAAPADATAGSSAGAAGGASSDSTTTQTSTKTRTQTVTMKKPQGTGAAAQPSPPALNADVPSNNDVADNAQCGPETVTVTAVEKVTVTVQPNVQPNSKKPNRKTTVVYVTAEPATSGAAAISEGGPAQSEAPAQSPVNTKPAVESPAPAVTPTDGGKPPVAPTGVSGSSAAVETSAGAGYPAPSSQVSESEVATPTASSAAAPKPSGSVSSSSKRGLIYRYDGGADAQTWVDAGIKGRISNWESYMQLEVKGAMFIPTLARNDPERIQRWSKDVKAAIAAGADTVYTYNEPDIGGQAEMSPEAACTAWNAEGSIGSIIKANPGINYAAPSVCGDEGTANMGYQWIQSFQKICPEAMAQTNRMNWHWYGNAGPDAFKLFKKHIDTVWELFPVTFHVNEFGLNPGATPQQVADFLAEAVPYLDAHEGCESYSMFAAGTFDTPHVLMGSAKNPTVAGSAYAAAS